VKLLKKTALEGDPGTVREATDPRNCLIIMLYLKNDVEIRENVGEKTLHITVNKLPKWELLWSHY
jgi:hypothetical protein